MVRHAFCYERSRDCRSAQPVSLLAISMVKPAFQDLLMWRRAARRCWSRQVRRQIEL
jgi:hypothetical protein